MKITNKIKWQDWSALGLLAILVLTVPISNAFIAGATNQILKEAVNLIDISFTQVSTVGMVLVQPAATLLIVYVAWRVQKALKTKTPVKKTSSAGKYIETPVK